MRALVLLALLGTVALGGCAGGDGGPAGAPDSDDSGVRATATTGIVRGVVVDERIVPIEGATVQLTGAATDQEATTDAEGRFAFGDLRPGTYFIAVRHFLHASAQSSAEVVAGEDEPPVVRVLLTRLFDQEPYSELFKFEGYIQCGYSNPQVSTQCVDDYTRFAVNGGLAPQVRELVDHRSYVHSVSAGWQSMILEMVWEPSAQGTSDELFIITSHYNRTGQHYYGRAEGTNPQLLRFDVGEVHSWNPGVEPEMIEPEGRNDLFSYAGVAGDVAIGFSQSFTIFHHNFYYGRPPDDWSFVAGDPAPF